VSDMRKEPQWVMLRVPSVPDGESARSIRKEVVSSLGSLVPSFLLSTCCLGPTLYVLFGVSVGGLSIFTSLEPYHPAFLLAALVLLGYAFYHLYIRPPQFDCVENGRSALRTSRVVFWIASLIFVVAALYPVVLPHVLF
jgi:mercuric ion transport protein